MDDVCLKDIFWFSVKLNPSIIIPDSPTVQLNDDPNLHAGDRLIRSSPLPPPAQPKDLLDLSAEKLVSDVGLLRYRTCYLPEKIRSILLFKAISIGRILSVVELVKYCPYEEFKIPVPSILKSYHVNKPFAKEELKKHYDVVVSIFSTYLKETVGQKNGSSRLKILDLGSAPICCGWLINRLKEFIVIQEKFIKDFKRSNNRKRNPKDIKRLKEIERKPARRVGNGPVTRSSSRKQNTIDTERDKEGGKTVTSGIEEVPTNPNLSQQYVIKCSIRVEYNHHIAELKDCFSKLKSTNLKVIFSGIFFLNIFCQEKDVKDLVEYVDQDSKLLSIMFSDFNPRLPSLLNLIENFTNLKYLNVSKLSLAQSQDLKPEFLEAISKLTTLKRLVLRDVKLTGFLSLLLCEFCQQDYSDSAVDRRCCLARCGSLNYLDVSGCSLGPKDLKFFQKLSYSKSLKYLDIGDNFLPVQSTCRTLLLLSSSLSVLHMAHCFDEYLEYNPEIFPLSKFSQLRVLTLNGIRPTQPSLRLLRSELEKINLNILKFGSETWVGCHLASLEILIRGFYHT